MWGVKHHLITLFFLHSLILHLKNKYQNELLEQVSSNGTGISTYILHKYVYLFGIGNKGKRL